jgi:hypothetical protein
MSTALELWSGAIYLIVRFALGLAVVVAFYRRGPERAWWLGFAAFGWIYMGACGEFREHEPRLPTQMLLDARYQSLVTTIASRAPRWFVNAGGFNEVWHSFWTLLAAVSGGALARTTFGAIASTRDQIAASAESARQRPLGRWIGPAVLCSSGLVFAVLIGIGGTFLAPEDWAGLTFLLTWWLLALAAVRASFSQGARRIRWLGASLLGAGFLILAFGRPVHDPWPIIPTVGLLDGIRPWVPTEMDAYPDGCDVSTPVNARVHTALERRVKMHYVDETALDDVLKDIQKETTDSGGKHIRIDVVPLSQGLPNLTMAPSVRMIALNDVPIRTGLQLSLEQLERAYHVRDGVLVIHHLESDDEHALSTGKAAYQIVGHCLLALLAAGIGGVLAPLVCDSRRMRSGAAASP